jgi:hypothetical protein
MPTPLAEQSTSKMNILLKLVLPILEHKQGLVSFRQMPFDIPSSIEKKHNI